jgi:tripartite-type tricarboxylate transporter receptor subunit TctC
MGRFVQTMLWVAATAMAVPLVAYSQAFPSRPVHIVIPFPPGSTLDVTSRMLAPKMSESMGQPVVIDNRPGANGMIGSEFVARSAPDGYILVFTTPSTHITSIFLSKNVPYDPKKDFTPIIAAVDPVTCLAVNPSVPVNSVKELIAYMKANPGKVAFGSSGIGSVFHLVGEMFKVYAGVDIVHVPYKGTAPMVQDAVSGQIQMIFSATNNMTPHRKSGKLKILAVLTSSRDSSMPEVPTAAEALPGFERPAAWFGLFGPAGMPPPVVARLNAEVIKALRAPDMAPKLEAAGLAVIGNTPQEFAAMYMSGFDVYGKVIRAAGIKPE